MKKSNLLAGFNTI